MSADTGAGENIVEGAVGAQPSRRRRRRREDSGGEHLDPEVQAAVEALREKSRKAEEAESRRREARRQHDQEVLAEAKGVSAMRQTLRARTDEIAAKLDALAGTKDTEAHEDTPLEGFKGPKPIDLEIQLLPDEGIKMYREFLEGNDKNPTERTAEEVIAAAYGEYSSIKSVAKQDKVEVRGGLSAIQALRRSRSRDTAQRKLDAFNRLNQEPANIVKNIPGIEDLEKVMNERGYNLKTVMEGPFVKVMAVRMTDNEEILYKMRAAKEQAAKAPQGNGAEGGLHPSSARAIRRQALEEGRQEGIAEEQERAEAERRERERDAKIDALEAKLAASEKRMEEMRAQDAAVHEALIRGIQLGFQGRVPEDLLKAMKGQEGRPN